MSDNQQTPHSPSDTNQTPKALPSAQLLDELNQAVSEIDVLATWLVQQKHSESPAHLANVGQPNAVQTNTAQANTMQIHTTPNHLTQNHPIQNNIAQNSDVVPSSANTPKQTEQQNTQTPTARLEQSNIEPANIEQVSIEQTQHKPAPQPNAEQAVPANVQHYAQPSAKPSLADSDTPANLAESKPAEPRSAEPKPATTEPKVAEQNTTTQTKAEQNKAEQKSAEPKPSASKKLKVAIAQMPFMVGDIASNLKRMKLAAKDAKEKGVDVLVFGEMALLGYPCGDVIKNPALAERTKSAIASLAEESRDMVILVGYPHIDSYGVFNSVAILQGGTQKGFYHKQCLQNDGIFNESAYFEAGLNQVIFDYKGVSIGLLIGKDLYKKQPIKALKEAGAEMVICLNASPFNQDKQEQRKSVLSAKAKSVNLPIVYANVVGGQEKVVFDGGSMIVGKDGKIMHEAARFLGQFLLGEYDVATGDFDEQQKYALVLSQEAELYQSLVVALRDYVNRSGFKGVIIGLSGGLDSALTLCIAVDALGADKVYAVMMPYQYTSTMSLEDAESQAKRLNVSYTVCPIFDAMAGFRTTLAPLFAESAGVDTTEENLQARIRGTILMALSNKFGHMVVNTSNKSESAVGYGTLYGDLVGGFGALADIYKTDVYRLANYRNRLEDEPVIPERVISRPPSAELRPNQKDQDSLPDYEILDGILRLYIEGNKSFDDIVKAGFDESLVAKVLKMVDKNEYKRRQAPFGTKTSARSFGERVYPIVQGWQHKVE